MARGRLTRYLARRWWRRIHTYLHEIDVRQRLDAWTVTGTAHPVVSDQRANLYDNTTYVVFPNEDDQWDYTNESDPWGR